MKNHDIGYQQEIELLFRKNDQKKAKNKNERRTHFEELTEMHEIDNSNIRIKNRYSNNYSYCLLEIFFNE